jgi:tape measure domain-containing protein
VADKKEILLIEIREDGARVVKKNIADVGKAGTATTNQMDKLKGVLAGLISAKVLRDTILLADSYANMLNRLRVVTSGTWELHAAMDAVFKMSRETRTALEANIDMYSRIAINTKQMGLGMKEVVRFATQLNHAIILSGVTAREAQWGMVQFSQGLAAGALRGDELRAVMEQLPIVTQTLTRFLGIGRGELRKWAFEGRVTTQVIIDAFNDAEKSLAERFGRRIPTVDQALTVLHSSITQFVGSMDQAIQGTSSLAKAILWLGDNMHTIGRIVLIVGTMLGTVFLKNLIMIIAQMKLFNLSVLAVHPLATAFLATAAAVVIFSDKIRIAKDSSATLSDVFKVLGERAKTAYRVLREGLGSLVSGLRIQREFEVTLESVVTDAAKFIDKFLGLFVGAGQVIKRIFEIIPNDAKSAWNDILGGVEVIVDYVKAVFQTMGDSIKIFALNVKAAMIAMSGAVRQALAGNVSLAKDYADQMAFSLKKAATDGFTNFSDILNRNLLKAADEDTLAGARFKIESAGESLAEAFIRGFDMSDLITTGVTDLFEQAKALSGELAGGPGEPGAAIFSPTPVQTQLLKDMIGDVGSINNKMLQLKELWEAINTQQPGTEGMQATLDQVNRKMAELRLKALSSNTDVISGFQRGSIKLGLEISNFATLAEKTVTNAFSSMEDALVQFVTTGKADFKGLVDSMLADMTRLLARQALTGILNTLSPDGGGILGVLAGVLAGGSGGSGAALPGRANGGPVSPGMSYMVGERGRPEIFQPAQPGHVTPTQQIAQAPLAQEGDVVILNVASEEEALRVMAGHEGKRIIRNEIRLTQSGR